MNQKSFAKVLYIIVIIAVIALLLSVISQGAQDNKELSSIDKLFEKIEAGEIYGVAMYNGGDVIMAVKSEKDVKDIEAKYD